MMIDSTLTNKALKMGNDPLRKKNSSDERPRSML